MKTPEEVGNEIAAQYGNEDLEFDDVAEVIHWAAIRAIHLYSMALVDEFSDKKQPAHRGMSKDAVMFNSGVYIAQDVILRSLHG